MKDISKIIRGKLSIAGMSIAELSRRTDIEYMRLYKGISEKDTRELTSSELVKICSVLNLRISDFE